MVSLANLNNLREIHKTQDTFMLSLHRGDSVVDSIQKCVLEGKLNSVSLSGIGAVDNLILGYYSLEEQRYMTREFEGVWELISLIGNVSFYKGKMKTHIHVMVSGGREWKVYGGHLVSANIAVVGEITVTPLKNRLVRELLVDSGHNLPVITKVE